MPHHRQVFQTDSPTRWTAIKWTLRIFVFVVALGVFSVCVALFKNSNPKMPKLVSSVDQFKKLLKPDQPLDFKEPFKKRKKKNEIIRKSPLQEQVRAGFYVNWDLKSYFSLKANISKMNMVLPEWLFVDPNGDSVIANIDLKAFGLLDTSKAKIVPLLTNNFGDKWNDSCVTRIVSTPESRSKFITGLMKVLRKWGFDGVSVDFEDLYSLHSDQDLVEFHRELYDSLHANKMIATQCIPPFNKDYKISELHKFNDYIFVMAYDQHFQSTKPGSISGGKWVEQVLDVFTAKIQPEKFILCLAGYGYDWMKGGTGADITYQEALTVAKESDAKIDFDNDGYNCHFNYTDETERAHEVWFTDAATTYNIMRTASSYGLAGVALWRLGSEDSRMWNFYDKNLTSEGLKLNPADISSMDYVKPSNDVDYIGEGEVLDILSSPEQGKINVEYDSQDDLISEETYLELPSSYVIKKFGKAKATDIFLTFDDGPDPKYTPEILDILKAENVPAAFFMVGENIESNIPIVKKIYDDGYEIGNHTFTHPNIADVTRERARLEMNATRRLIEIITGHSTVMFRPPFNADAEPQDLAEIIPVEESRKENYITIGESIDPQDWDNKNITADSIFDRIIRQQALGNVILLHDAGGDRSKTVEVLPRIIHYFKSKGYHFATIAELVGKTKLEMMPAVSNPKEKLFNNANFVIADTLFLIQHFIYGLFFIGIFLSIGRMVFLGILASIQNVRSKFKKEKFTGKPLVSIIVPAYNESVTAVKTVANLLRLDYPNYEIIFVNDGSKDNTYEIVKSAFAGNEKVKVLDKVNGGKASALNFGVQHAEGAFVVCIDADTQLKEDAVSRLMESFINDDIGAVAGNVKVGNELNMLTKWQSIEYTTAQNFDRKAFDILNCITVIPGAIGAFRKEAIEDAGGFASDTLAEDCDLTIRILRSGYIVTTNNRAIAMTEAPEKLGQFLKQRFRWCFGVMQTFWKNRDACFNPKYKALGLLALPNILIFQIILPFFAPLADLLMIVGLIAIFREFNSGTEAGAMSMSESSAERMLFYYMIFQLVDLAGAVLAFSFERENITKLWMLIPQRFTYRWLMYYVFFKAFSKALKGELQSWGVLKRTGNVAGNV
ncbi:MAG: glycosyltransferase [Bacteroidota bacterium]|nr:glycosyltransferase [Bacteroidota bacterium]